MKDWISLKQEQPPIGATISVLHYGNWPETRHVQHRAMVYRDDKGHPDPRPPASYTGYFASKTITHWKPVEESSDA